MTGSSKPSSDKLGSDKSSPDKPNFASANNGYALPIRVYIEDTDAGGIVYYANYLKFFERARTEFIRSLGFDLRHSLSENISYVVHSLDIKYIKSAKLDDLIDVTVEIEKIGRTYFLFRQRAMNEYQACLAEGYVKVACVNLGTAKPRRLPEELYEKLGQIYVC